MALTPGIGTQQAQLSHFLNYTFLVVYLHVDMASSILVLFHPHLGVEACRTTIIPSRVPQSLRTCYYA